MRSRDDFLPIRHLCLTYLCIKAGQLSSRKTMSSKIDFWPSCSGSPECFTMAERDFELAAEIESHLQMRNDDHLRSNLTYDETRRAAC
jgi:hypothetical protein